MKQTEFLSVVKKEVKMFLSTKLKLKFKKSFLVLVMLFFSAAGFSLEKRGAQELVECGSWVYDALAAISMETGRADLSNQAPCTVNEIKMYLNEADYDSLSEGGKTLWHRIDDYINHEYWAFSASIFSVGIDPEINLEGFYKSEDDLQWVYDRYNRKSLINVPFFIQAKDYFTMKMDVDLRENKGTTLYSDNYTNIPSEAREVDVNFPSTGYFSAGIAFSEDAFANFRIGLGTQSVGRSLTGSIILSEYFTGSSWANLEFYSPNLRYNMNVTQFNVDQYMYNHSLEFRFFKKLTFSASESVFVFAPLELRFLNPLTIYHGFSPWRDYDPDKSDSETHTTAYLTLHASFVPVKYLRIYGMFAMTQFQTPYELENYPNDVTPNGIGGQAGIESYIPFAGGYFHTWLEGYYAQPYLYVKESPNWTLVRTYSENIGDHAVFYEWIGSPFGPDTISAQLNFGYEKPGKWSVTASYLFKAAGEYSGTKIFTEELDWGGVKTDFDERDDNDLNKWAYPDRDAQGIEEAKRRQHLVTPSGTPEYSNRISVKGTLSMNDWFTLTAQPAYTFIYNFNNTEGKFAHGIEFAVSANIKIKELISK